MAGDARISLTRGDAPFSCSDRAVIHYIVIVIRELCGLRVRGSCCKAAEAAQRLKRGTAMRAQVNARRFILPAVDAHVGERGHVISGTDAIAAQFWTLMPPLG